VIFDAARRLDAGEELEVRVEFTPDVVVGSAPSWQQGADAEAAQREQQQAYLDQWGPVASVGLGALGLLLFFGGPLGVYLLWFRFGRDKPVVRVADYLTEPPDTLPPGLAGALLDDSADMQDIVATIVDLARRRVISITEERTEGFWKSGTDFIYRRERDDTPLEPFEKKVLDSVMGAKDEVRLSDLKNKFYSKIDGIKSQMYADLIARGYYKQSPDSARTQFGCLGVALIVGSVGIGFIVLLAAGDLTAAAFCPGIGLFVTALAMLIAARFMPRKADPGAEAAARWSAFREYLKNMDKYGGVAEQKEIWDRWLPYAIAFGCDKDYIRKFEAVDAPAPGWYIPSPTLYGPYRRRYFGPDWNRPVVLPGGMPDAGSLGGGEGGSLGGGLSDASKGLAAVWPA
jgi:uncharacterized membrane protein